MRTKLKIPSYLTISKITFFISICLITIAIISFFWTLITVGRFYIDITSEGWNGFLNYYSPQLKIAGVGLAFFIIWMTAERMKQTQDQIRSIVENNRFNNFYKHRDEFIKHLSSQQFMVNIAKYSDFNLNDLLLTYHRMFYTSRYENFSPEIHSSKLEDIKEFCGALNDEKVLNYNLEEYIVSGDSTLSISKPAEFYLETNKAFSFLIENDTILRKWFSTNSTSRYAIQELCQLYYTYRIYMNIIAFSGEKYSGYVFPQFIANLTSFFKRSGISKLNLD